MRHPEQQDLGEAVGDVFETGALGGVVGAVGAATVLLSLKDSR